MSNVNSVSAENTEALASVIQAQRNNSVRAQETPESQSKQAERVSVTEAKVTEVLDELREFLGSQKSMSFSIRIDKELREPVISVVDEITGERVLQVPTEQALKISKAILEMRGLFVDQSA